MTVYKYVTKKEEELYVDALVVQTLNLHCFVAECSMKSSVKFVGGRFIAISKIISFSVTVKELMKNK